KNTGIYSVGADDLGIATNGTLRMDINTIRVRSQLPVYVENGSATAPSYTFNTDTNTGMYSVGADNLGFSTNSTLRMDISDTRVAIAQTTTSTSETTGALTVAGGIGASNRCYLRALTCGEG